MSIWTAAFWKAAAERAVKSAAQSVIVMIGADAIFDALTADWQLLGGAALGGGFLSLLTSIGSDALTGGTGPSLTNAEIVPGKHAAR